MRTIAPAPATGQNPASTLFKNDGKLPTQARWTYVKVLAACADAPALTVGETWTFSHFVKTDGTSTKLELAGFRPLDANRVSLAVPWRAGRTQSPTRPGP